MSLPDAENDENFVESVGTIQDQTLGKLATSRLGLLYLSPAASLSEVERGWVRR